MSLLPFLLFWIDNCLNKASRNISFFVFLVQLRWRPKWEYHIFCHPEPAEQYSPMSPAASDWLPGQVPQAFPIQFCTEGELLCLPMKFHCEWGRGGIAYGWIYLPKRCEKAFWQCIALYQARRCFPLNKWENFLLIGPANHIKVLVKTKLPTAGLSQYNVDNRNHTLIWVHLH